MAKPKKEDSEFIELNIKHIKEEYEKLRKKYSLPSFSELNEEFDISKAETTYDTLLRDIRKAMVAKFIAIMGFVELLLNPSNGSMFNMFLVRGISQNEKDILNKLFDQIGFIEIESFSLDIIYSEEKEAEFIKKQNNEWKKIRPELDKVINSLKSGWGKENSKKGKSYFG